MARQGKQIEVITVRLPEPLVGLLDTLIKKGIFNSRSEAIREFSRQYVLEQHERNPHG